MKTDPWLASLRRTLSEAVEVTVGGIETLN